MTESCGKEYYSGKIKRVCGKWINKQKYICPLCSEEVPISDEVRT